MIALSAAHRAAAGVAAGDTVDVTLEVDDAPREVEVPADLADALAAAGVTEPFGRLSYSAQRAHVLSVEGAKTEATRSRRISAVLAFLT